MTTKTLLTAATSLALAGASSAAITEDASVFAQNNSGNVSTTIDASGSDMLVVFVTGEHGFNNTNGQSNDVTYDGVSLTEIVDRDPVVSPTDIAYASVWVLENPGAVHTAGALVSDNTTRGVLWAVALSGDNALVVGDSGFSGSNTRSIDLTVAAGSYIAAGFNLGGAGNNGSVSGVAGDAPLTDRGGLVTGSNWNGLEIGTQNGSTAGTNSYSFSGGSIDGALVTAIEIQEVIPEPGSLALLGLGGLLVARRRRG